MAMAMASARELANPFLLSSWGKAAGVAYPSLSLSSTMRRHYTKSHAIGGYRARRSSCIVESRPESVARIAVERAGWFGWFGRAEPVA
jgi:hypothetical protein